MKFILLGIFTLCVYTYSGAAEIYYKDAVIMGEENVFVIGDSEDIESLKTLNTKTETSSDVSLYTSKDEEEESQADQPKVIVMHLPFMPSPLTYLHNTIAQALPAPQRRIYKQHLLLWQIQRENTCPDTENSDLLPYLPEQRQKLSPAAMQYGILTSFSPNSPSFLLS